MSLQKRLGNNLSDAGIARVSMSQDGCLYNVGGQNLTTLTTSEEVLATITVQRNLLYNVREGLYIWAFGTTKNNGNNKQVRIRLVGLTGSIVADTGAVALNNGAFMVEGWILRAGANSSELVGRTAMGTTPTTSYLADVTTAMATLGSVVITGATPTAAGDLILKGYRVCYVSRGGVMTAGGVLA